MKKDQEEDGMTKCRRTWRQECTGEDSGGERRMWKDKRLRGL